MNYVVSRFSGRAVVLFLLAAVVPSLAFADLNEEQKLLTPTASGSNSGQSSAMSDDGMIAVVGAPGDSGNGKAYVFTRSGTVWTLAATLSASDGAAGDKFGASVAISGDASGPTSANIAVGAPGRGSAAGAVYVYTGNGTTWTENTHILTSGLAAGGSLGASVSIQGFRIAAGAPNATAGKGANAGLAVVFDSTDGGGSFSASPFRANGGQARVGGHFGTSVSLSGSTVLVGAPNYTTGHKNSGNVFVFVNNGGTWTQQASIRPSNTTNNFAGTAVSLFSNSAAFGAPGNANNKGAVYVYSRAGTLWTQQAAVTAPGGAAGDNFGASVAQLGTFLVAGAPFANSNGGKAYEFGLVGGSYSLLNNLIATDNAQGDQFGTSLSVNSSRVAVGAPTGSAGNGLGYVFKFLGSAVVTIPCFSSDPNTCVSQEPSLTGVPYTVFVNVVTGDLPGTPSGTVDLNDSFGGTCTATLDGSGNGHCTLTSNHFGMLTMLASYNGDSSFAPSSGTRDHTITGNHLAFVPAPANVLQGEQVSGVVVQVLNGANQLITGDSTTQVTLSSTDTCDLLDVNTIATQTVSGGTTTFTGVGPKFYTVTTGGALVLTATSNNTIVTANSNFDVDPNGDIVFADGFEECRL